jgi:hypothetical protein
VDCWMEFCAEKMDLDSMIHEISPNSLRNITCSLRTCSQLSVMKKS